MQTPRPRVETRIMTHRAESSSVEDVSVLFVDGSRSLLGIGKI